ncbi:uncharacterized protein L969DRAFT_516238 [Mixia osmundae IAM 14324]|uniref:uncharacterized protein n=1 Tax=Mixia osmundae (strain CBS 9802 / IAM 14324 / JCM 22182 / KY 12970) TaxID=764103 RepID=UPI0004A54B2E|nr:uncharacterized protein L969DRAFT_516238 [Mixia osmundae IAM 14324]KEI39150.1 hypothetical protein L969DRAFT_516238 [Mixia osmundae IAM 14324]
MCHSTICHDCRDTRKSPKSRAEFAARMTIVLPALALWVSMLIGSSSAPVSKYSYCWMITAGSTHCPRIPQSLNAAFAVPIMPRLDFSKAVIFAELFPFLHFESASADCASLSVDRTKQRELIQSGSTNSPVFARWIAKQSAQWSDRTSTALI